MYPEHSDERNACRKNIWKILVLAICLIYLLITSVWNVKLVKGWIRPALVLVLQLLNCCASRKTQLLLNHVLPCFVRVCGEGCFKQLVAGSAVYEWNHEFGVAVGVRAGALVLHHRAGGLWHMIWFQHLVYCGVLLGLKNCWACGGLSCDVKGKLRKQGVKENVLWLWKITVTSIPLEKEQK